MSKLTRREMLLSSAALLTTAASEIEANEIIAELAAYARPAQVGKVDQLTDNVYFHQGNLLAGHCNNGWVIFDDYVLVIDANYPSGALEILPKIRALTDKPIRFAFDTHHHGDHAYGNQIWVENGATPVAHTGVVEELKKYEPGRWEDSAKTRADVRASKLKLPTLLFPHELFFDDGKRRVELHHLGIAHTHGDAFAWLPNEKILFSGDACVNGPYNFVGDGDTEKWLGTLEAAKKLGAKIVCPGHGPRGIEIVLAEQQRFFASLRTSVGKLVKAKKAGAQIRDTVTQISTELKADQTIARYVGTSLAAQVEKVYTEMTGQTFPAAQKSALNAKDLHAHAHGRTHVHLDDHGHLYMHAHHA
ncbi:MAG: MBL fold metallo-hydrolase [Acidobacteria bacterium]|nr:MBL fold metallo-hydrolase [Acidobacteriota bacterium]MBI3428445.1 MBL fold metallo-hydrolase [Acidobacteriota bacterium]